MRPGSRIVSQTKDERARATHRSRSMRQRVTSLRFLLSFALHTRLHTLRMLPSRHPPYRRFPRTTTIQSRSFSLFHLRPYPLFTVFLSPSTFFSLSRFSSKLTRFSPFSLPFVRSFPSFYPFLSVYLLSLHPSPHPTERPTLPISLPSTRFLLSPLLLLHLHRHLLLPLPSQPKPSLL